MEEQDKKAFLGLKERFDRFFYNYCTTLRVGVSVKIFTEDTADNRLLIGEFRRYLGQRAKYEGWKYNPENFQIVYVADAKKLAKDKIALYNPHKENLGFRELGEGFVRKICQKRANKIRDNLLSLLESSD